MCGKLLLLITLGSAGIWCRVLQAVELRRKFFTPSINYPRYLVDGLVGSDQVDERSPLKPSSWAFVLSDKIAYVGEGTTPGYSVFHLQSTDALVTVLALHSKKAGAGANHTWQKST